MPDRAAWATTVAFALITATVGGVVFMKMDEIDGEQFGQRVECCQDQGGDAVISRALYHGGLHCEFENGTLVHVPNAIPTNGSGAVA